MFLTLNYLFRLMPKCRQPDVASKATAGWIRKPVVTRSCKTQTDGSLSNSAECSPPIHTRLQGKKQKFIKNP